jgi:hypothetical protein
LWETKVTDAGADDLKKAMPTLMISRGWENEPAAKQAMEEMKAKKEEPKKDDKKPADKKEAKN